MALGSAEYRQACINTSDCTSIAGLAKNNDTAGVLYMPSAGIKS